jgi:hypothetical protein
MVEEKYVLRVKDIQDIIDGENFQLNWRLITDPDEIYRGLFSLGLEHNAKHYKGILIKVDGGVTMRCFGFLSTALRMNDPIESIFPDWPSPMLSLNGFTLVSSPLDIMSVLHSVHAIKKSELRLPLKCDYLLINNPFYGKTGQLITTCWYVKDGLARKVL